MNPLLEQFLSESREFSQLIGDGLMQLETTPTDENAINELFRLVHTLKGNSGLFTFPEMTRVLHAGEDLLDLVRNGKLPYSRALADQLLDALDLVMGMCADIEKTEAIDPSRGPEALRMTEALRALMPAKAPPPGEPVLAASAGAASAGAARNDAQDALPSIDEVSEGARAEARRQCDSGETPHWITYVPSPECFFQGEDPFHAARLVPGLFWGRVLSSEPLPPLEELDIYRCGLTFHIMTSAPREEILEHFRYVPEDVKIVPVDRRWLDGLAVGAEGQTVTPASAANHLVATPPEIAVLHTILAVQRQVLLLDDQVAWQTGRMRAVSVVLGNVARFLDESDVGRRIEPALAESVAALSSEPLLKLLDELTNRLPAPVEPPAASQPKVAEMASTQSVPGEPADDAGTSVTPVAAAIAGAPGEDASKFNRRVEDSNKGTRTLKVDQAKIDRLMNLIGELVVEKNALPYLAQRAEVQYGVRELSREIRSKHGVINRIADEMQDAIMQVRMMAVSHVFQRFPRLVRDISRKLGKEVRLVLEGEQTEADKDIVESLGDPLIHIIRNSLDHGLEVPEVRRACGKPETGTLTIRAAQEAGRAVIEIIDDGKGIDPGVIKRKAYEKGLIDEAALERIGDQEAVNLIFAAGFSTAEVISDLSGRGVGMDVVRTAVEKINGTVIIESAVGKGTKIRISLPLSMAVTQVMIVETDGQLFGVPMDHVVETVRVPRSAVRFIKQSMTAILRGRVVPLKALNGLLGIAAQPRTNLDDELAILLVQVGEGILGLLVDGFQETVDVIQKPLDGFLSALSVCSGSALMGDGSVLMILNLREIV